MRTIFVGYFVCALNPSYFSDRIPHPKIVIL